MSKTSLDLKQERDDGVLGWQWHQLDHMQTSLQTDIHTNTSSLNFYRLDDLPDAQPTVSKHGRHAKIAKTISLIQSSLVNWHKHCFCVSNNIRLESESLQIVLYFGIIIKLALLTLVKENLTWTVSHSTKKSLYKYQYYQSQYLS